MLAIENESYQSVSNNWRHDTNVLMTFAFLLLLLLLLLLLFFFHVVLHYTNTQGLQSSAYFRVRRAPK